jgi:hypothetical protein
MMALHNDTHAADVNRAAIEIINETRRIADQIHASTQGSHEILTRLSIIYSAGLAAVVASDFPQAFALVPILATLQALFTLSKDRETQALGLWARVLERRSNDVLGTRLFAWEDLIAARGTTHPVMSVQLVFQMLLIFGSWIAAVVLLVFGDLPPALRPWDIVIRPAYLGIAVVGMLSISFAEASRLDLRERLRLGLAEDTHCDFRSICEDLITETPDAGPLHRMAVTLHRGPHSLVALSRARIHRRKRP